MLFTAPFLLPIICILHHTTVAHPTPPPSCASTASESNSLPLADLQAAAAQIPNNSSAVLLPEKTINWESGSLELTLTQNSTSPIPPPPPEPNTLPPNNATKPTATTWEEVYNATRDMVELCGTRANGFTINDEFTLGIRWALPMSYFNGGIWGSRNFNVAMFGG